MVQPPRPAPARPQSAPIPREDALSAEQRGFRRALQGEMRREWATLAIVALNVAAFVASVAGGLHPVFPEGPRLIEWGANYAPLTRGGEGWRLFTSMFMHAGLIHLGANMYALWLGGRLTERVFGHVAFTWIYLFAGTAGSVASALTPPAVASVGASGAVFGVFGALLAFLVRRRALLPAEVFKPLRSVVVVFVLFNLAFGFALPGIDQAAHVGGLAAGFVAGLALVPSMSGDRLRRPRAGYVVAAVAWVGVVALVHL